MVIKVNRDDFKSSGKKEEDAEGGEVTESGEDMERMLGNHSESGEDMERVLGSHSKPLPI